MLATGPAPPPPPATTTVVATSSSDNGPAAAQQRPALRCPRCDSSNTKFCYYNNYSLSQPRHFCKSCRRYWTHGGALRNVPIGGASRKSKKPRRSSLPPPSGPTAPIVDFQLGGSLLSNSFPPLTRLNYPTNLSSPFGDLNLNPPPPPPPSNLLGLNNYPLITTTSQAGGGGGGGGDSLLASSIESLSSLNQELHWKLQQQRMSLIFDDVAPVEAVAVTTNNSHVDKKPQSIFFQNLEATNSFAHHHHSTTGGTHQDQSTNSPNINQWFFDTSYGGGGSGSGSRNNHCGDGNENEESENVASRLNTSGGYVLDKDGVIKFQQYAQWLGMKKI